MEQEKKRTAVEINIKQYLITDDITVLGHTFHGLKDVREHCTLSARNRLDWKPVAINKEKNCDSSGVYVAKLYEPYPKFDASDYLYDDRDFENYIFRSHPIDNEEIKRVLQLNNSGNFCLVSNETPVEAMPILYYRGEGNTMLLATAVEHKRYTPERIASLGPDEVFVFGSNLAGAHGGGAARAALEHFGAVWGQGVGLQGQSYAIPTMQGGVETIKPYVDEFVEFAIEHKELTFLVTRVGCGIAGFRDEEIAPLFVKAIDVPNIVLPRSFVSCIDKCRPVCGTGRKTRIYNLIILDESGSMHRIEQAAIDSVNETLQTILAAQEKHPQQEHFVSLVIFNTSVKSLYESAPVDAVKELDTNSYNPRSCTALYDAMGMSLTALRQVTGENDKVLVTIVTDGYENSSKKYTQPEIKSLVDELKQEGWVFAYMGANHDAEKIAFSLSINNSMTFSATATGMAGMSHAVCCSRKVLYEEIARESFDADEANRNFFDKINKLDKE